MKVLSHQHQQLLRTVAQIRCSLSVPVLYYTFCSMFVSGTWINCTEMLISSELCYMKNVSLFSSLIYLRRKCMVRKAEAENKTIKQSTRSREWEATNCLLDIQQ